jgi:hypothetical protein
MTSRPTSPRADRRRRKSARPSRLSATSASPHTSPSRDGSRTNQTSDLTCFRSRSGSGSAHVRPRSRRGGCWRAPPRIPHLDSVADVDPSRSKWHPFPFVTFALARCPFSVPVRSRTSAHLGSFHGRNVIVTRSRRRRDRDPLGTRRAAPDRGDRALVRRLLRRGVGVRPVGDPAPLGVRVDALDRRRRSARRRGRTPCARPRRA